MKFLKILLLCSLLFPLSSKCSINNPLHQKTAFEYAQEGNLEQLKKIKLDVAARTKDNYTLLHLAAEHNHSNIVDFLLTQGADINAQNKWGATPLHLAVEKNFSPNELLVLARYLVSNKVFQLLIKNKADLNAQNNNGNTPLHIAVRDNKQYFAHTLLTHGANINAQNNNGDTPLHLTNNISTIKILLTHGADINAQNKSSYTPLHFVSEIDSLDVVKFLVQNGADINAQTTSGDTPLHLAAEYNTLDVIQFLIESGADITTQNNNGDTPLDIQHSDNENTLWHQTILSQNTSLANLLVNKGAHQIPLNIIDPEGNTPLHLAVASSNLHFAQFLISNGADLQIPNKKNESPLTIQDAHGNTLLHLAIASGNISLAKILIENGANLKIPNHNQETPLTIQDTHGNTILRLAFTSSDFPLAKILIENGANRNEVQNLLGVQDQFGDTILHHIALANDTTHFDFFSSLNPELLHKPNHFHHTPAQIKDELTNPSHTPTKSPAETHNSAPAIQHEDLTEEEQHYTTERFKNDILQQIQDLHLTIMSNIQNFKEISFSITNENNEIENIKIVDLLSQHTSPLPAQKDKAASIFQYTVLGNSLKKINTFIIGVTFSLKKEFKETLYPDIIRYKDLTQKALFSCLSQKNIKKNEIENLLQNLKTLEKEVASITIPICMAFLSTLPPMNNQIFYLTTISPNYQARLLIPPATNLLLHDFEELKNAFQYKRHNILIQYTHHDILSSTFSNFHDGSDAQDAGGVKRAYNQQIFNLFNAKKNSNFFSNPGDASKHFTSLNPQGLALNPDIILTFKNEEEKKSFLSFHMESIEDTLKSSWYRSFLKSNKQIIRRKNIKNIYSQVTRNKETQLFGSFLNYIKNTTRENKNNALKLFGLYLFYGLVHFQYPTSLCAKKYYSALECDYNPENPRMYLEYAIDHNPQILDYIMTESDTTKKIHHMKNYSHDFSPQELKSLQSLHDGFWGTDSLPQESTILDALTTSIPQDIVTINEIIIWANNPQTLNRYEIIHLDTLGMRKAIRDIFSILTASDYAYLFQPQITAEDVINMIEYGPYDFAHIPLSYDHSLIEKEFKRALEAYLKKSPENLSAFVTFVTGARIPTNKLKITFSPSEISFAHTCFNALEVSIKALSDVIVNKVIEVNNITRNTHNQNPELSSIVEKKQDGEIVLTVTIKNHKPIDIPTQQIEDALQEYIANISGGSQQFTSR